MKVIAVDLENEHIAGPVTVRAYLKQTLGEFKELVRQRLGLGDGGGGGADGGAEGGGGAAPVVMRCVLEKYYNELKPLSDDSRTLKADGFFKSNKVRVTARGAWERQGQARS